jgi:hypothetical protein
VNRRAMLTHGAIHLFVLTAGLGIGFAFGSRHGFIQGMRYVQAQVAEDLALDVELASSIRVGNGDRALALLELRVDETVLALASAERNIGYLAAQGNWSALESLGRAKLYRTAVPPTGPDAMAVQSALKDASSVQGRHPIGPSLSKLAHGGR